MRKKNNLTKNKMKGSVKEPKHLTYITKNGRKLKKLNPKYKEDVSELVDEKGGKIHGDKHLDQSGTMTTSVDTTDDHVLKSRQGDPFYRRYYGESISDKEKTLDEVAKSKMKKVVEDILTKKKFDKDVIDKVKYSNGIPDVEVLKDDLPVLVRKIAHIKTLLEREEVNGEEKAILLNSLLSIDLTDIPSQYKRELVRKLGY